MSSIIFTNQAVSDLEDAFAYYFDAANLALAERFRDAVAEAVRHIEHHPGTGSSRYNFASAEIPLRFWTLNHFPYAVFYFAYPERTDIVRVLHQASDIPQHLQH